MASAWLVFVPLTLYVAPRYGLVAAWSCVIVYFATMSSLIWLRFRGTAWLKPAVERAGAANEAETAGSSSEARAAVESS